MFVPPAKANTDMDLLLGKCWIGNDTLSDLVDLATGPYTPTHGKLPVSTAASPFNS